MKAAVHTRYGAPDVVGISEVDKPAAKDDELLVKVHAATVNRTDAAYRAARPFVVRSFTGLTKPKVTVLGNEFAGTVEAIGREVTAFQVGDRVFGYNEGPFGAHAEYMTIPEDGSVATIPDYFNTNRMVGEYVDMAYLPAHRAGVRSRALAES